MTGKIKSSNQKGFTIIEVMIVLAIAGIIMMLVFLAIPALQRSNRNTQIRSDVASVLGFVNEYAVNNNGRLPATVCANIATGDVGAVLTGPCNGTTHKVGTIRSQIIVETANTMPGTTGIINVALGRKCEGNVLSTTPSPRTTAALYRVETAGDPIEQCQES